MYAMAPEVYFKKSKKNT